jgi:predicted nuclease of predicted toxin-antitoxin system
MQFIVDESTGVAVIEYLRAAGYRVLAIGESMPQAVDKEILERAESEGYILITNDKDFGELVFRSGLAHHGVLLLRLRDEGSANRVNVVKLVLEKYADRLAENFVVATKKGYALDLVNEDTNASGISDSPIPRFNPPSYPRRAPPFRHAPERFGQPGRVPA